MHTFLSIFALLSFSFLLYFDLSWTFASSIWINHVRVKCLPMMEITHELECLHLEMPLMAINSHIKFTHTDIIFLGTWLFISWRKFNMRRDNESRDMKIGKFTVTNLAMNNVCWYLKCRGQVLSHIHHHAEFMPLRVKSVNFPRVLFLRISKC